MWSYARIMKRVVLIVLGAYLLAALLTRAAEAKGIHFECGCHDDCWCKRPGIGLFRWVTPRRVHHAWSEDEKRAFDEELARARAPETD